jgi:hypothetical protein
MNKCTPNSKDLKSHLFPSLIPFLGKEYFMCRECIFQRSYYYLYITLTQQLINDGYKRKKCCLIEKSRALPQKKKSRANSMIKHVAVYMHCVPVFYHHSHKGAGLTLQQYLTPNDWDRQRHQQ